MNPSLGRNFEALDPLEWLARMSDHLGPPHRQDLPGRSARLHSLRPEDADDRLPDQHSHILLVNRVL